MYDIIASSAREGVKAIEFLTRNSSIAFMERVAQELKKCFEVGGKLLVAGNGGSLCDAMHFAEELTGQFRDPRPALPAIALSDPGHITCAANDFGFENIFSRSVEALGQEGDVLVCLTTSGNSENIRRALLAAKRKGMYTISFLGKTGGVVKGLADLEWIVEGFTTSDRIQEAHMTAIHIIIEALEASMFSTVKAQEIEV